MDLNAAIVMPGVPNGLGAILFSTGRHPNVLEIYTYGEDHSDGLYDGFVFANPPNQSMEPTARWPNNVSVLATTPCRGLSLSR
jgi:hypothetical protein